MMSRDNFYVRAKVSHKSQARQELSFDLGDIFHVTDTEPGKTHILLHFFPLPIKEHFL